MIYINREHMNILNVNSGDKIFLSQLKFLIDSPTSVIYVEKQCEYYGKITHEDIKQASFFKQNYVKVEKCKFLLNEKNYYKALNIFKNNQELDSIPLVINNKLKGEYKRSDSQFSLETQEPFIHNKHFKPKGRIALVKPSDNNLINNFKISMKQIIQLI